jgi:hypothetical protein
VLEDGIAKALAKEGLISHEHVGRAQMPALEPPRHGNHLEHFTAYG